MNHVLFVLVALLSLASAQLNTRVPGRIEAESFTGKRELSSNNLGGIACGVTQSRPLVDLQRTSDPQGGNCNVGWIQASEFLVYASPVFARTADYTIRLRVAASSNNANTVRVQVGSVTRTVVFRGSGGWQEWTDVYVNMGRITQGAKRIQITFVTGNLNFNFFEVRQDGAYNIEWGFNGVRTPQITRLLAQTETACRVWERIITRDLANGRSNQFSRDVDDLYIDITFPAIDGPGSVLGSAGPREIRGGTNGLPLTGVIRFDIADAQSLLNRNQFDEVVRHEIGHVLGIGSFWRRRAGVIINPDSNDPRYTLPFATAQYRNIFGNSATSIPVANTGGSGSRLSHWRESTFDNELMTPRLNFGGVNPLSRMTVEGLRDLGYSVNINRAEPYNRPSKRSISGRRLRRKTFECSFDMPEIIVLNE